MTEKYYHCDRCHRRFEAPEQSDPLCPQCGRDDRLFLLSEPIKIPAPPNDGHERNS